MNKHLIVIAGPTGVGKTNLGIWLAEQIGTEIISADSRQIYRELAVGTAVPDSLQLKAVRHHFIQSHSIHDYYNASIYENQVIECLDLLFKKYDHVILLGGTGLYIDAVRHGIDDLPKIDMKVRKGIQKRLDEEGLESLRFDLKRLDPLSYNRIDLKNPKRVQKALEIIEMTGKPYSEFLTASKKKRNFNISLIALNHDRNILYDRINRRTLEMIANGWIDEVLRVQELRYLNALNTVGYKELFAYLDGLYTLDEAVERIQANTRKYARKQITWFRKEKNYKWFSPDQREDILKYIFNETGNQEI